MAITELDAIKRFLESKNATNFKYETIKISTINSFKGWESEVVFLIIEPKYERSTTLNMSFDELLYTGLTRTKRNLFVVNFGNAEYDQKMRPLIESLK